MMFLVLDGEFCPSESGWAVGDCLKKVGIQKLSKECASFIKLQDVCKADIDAYCGGKEYSGDLLVCLTEWVRLYFFLIFISLSHSFFVKIVLRFYSKIIIENKISSWKLIFN